MFFTRKIPVEALFSGYGNSYAPFWSSLTQSVSDNWDAAWSDSWGHWKKTMFQDGGWKNLIGPYAVYQMGWGRAIENTQYGYEAFSHLLAGNYYQAGSMGGYQGGQGSLELGLLAITGGVARGVNLAKWGGNFNFGKNFQISVMSKVQAPGMSGHRVLGFKYGKFQGAIDYHNWVLRKSGQAPIIQKFWHYHWGRGKAGGHHRQFGTGNKILDAYQLRNGWLGQY